MIQYSVNMKTSSMKLDESTTDSWHSSESTREELRRDARLMAQAQGGRPVTIESNTGKWLAVVGVLSRCCMICDHCGRPIKGTPFDPVYSISAGAFHGDCAHIVAGQTVGRAQKAHEQRADGRGAAARSRWASMTPEQKASQIAKMQAGRKSRIEQG